MKIKTTNKYIKAVYPNIKYAGYCELWYLLSVDNPIAYTSGVYGWNYDVYYINGVTICTGYRGMPGERAQGITEYEQKAREIANNFDIQYDERSDKINALLKEFCVLNGGY